MEISAILYNLINKATNSNHSKDLLVLSNLYTKIVLRMGQISIVCLYNKDRKTFYKKMISIWIGHQALFLNSFKQLTMQNSTRPIHPQTN